MPPSSSVNGPTRILPDRTCGEPVSLEVSTSGLKETRVQLGALLSKTGRSQAADAAQLRDRADVALLFG
jgi:hypothetical protein